MKRNKSKRIPKILKINNINKKDLKISVLFSNGEDRIIDFWKIFNDKWKIKKNDVEYKLLSPIEFAKVTVINHSLCITGKNNLKRQVPYQIGADTLFELSDLDSSMSFSIGEMFRKARLKAKKSQVEVAESAGTSRTYITRLENNQQDVEIMTLKKLIEAGLNKHLRISIV
jgi:DNA-binding XRE family transcriptional regulator